MLLRLDGRLATIFFNVVDSTAGALPVTSVDPHRDALPSGFTDIPEGSDRSWILERNLYGGTQPAYDADKMAGMPVGIQVVCPPWQEEKTLAIMAIVEQLVDYNSK